MKSICMRSAVAVLLFLAITCGVSEAQRAGSAGADSADAVIRHHIEAIGGETALRSVETLMYRGRNLGLGSEDRPLARYFRRPNLLRQQVPGEGSYLLADGKAVYSVSPAGAESVTAPWAKELLHMDIDGGFLDYGEKGIVYSFKGVKTFGGGPWRFNVLERTYPDGFTEELYFETDTGLLRMIDRARDSSRLVLYEYRKVGSILFPHLQVRIFDIAKGFPHPFAVDTVIVNGSFDESLFSRGE